MRSTTRKNDPRITFRIKGEAMKERHRVERVFEIELDSVLKKIDKKGAELLRVLDLPKGPLKSSDCKCCSEKMLCEVHMAEHRRIQSLNQHDVKLDRRQLSVWLPRYALVYRSNHQSGKR